MSTYQRQVADVIKQATAQGWRERESHGDHHQLFAPDGKGIVTTPRNTTEHRAFANFMADMKRHGFMIPSDRERLMADRANKTARQRLLAYGEKHPDGIITPQDVALILKVSATAAQQAIGKLFDEGRLVRVSHGQYRWEQKFGLFEVPASNDEADETPSINGAGTTMATEVVAQPPVAVSSPAPQPSPSIRDDDAAELEELAAAVEQVLTGLARLEPIVKRNLVLARKLQDAKRALFGD